MWFPSLPFFSSLIVTSHCQGKFYKLEEDGSILCETRGDCPNDVVNKTNNTVLEFRCAPRTTVGEPGAKESESGSPKYFLETSLIPFPPSYPLSHIWLESLSMCDTVRVW